ncbi:MAG: hypothetical protein ABI390_04180 [Daejeonella sp.]
MKKLVVMMVIACVLSIIIVEKSSAQINLPEVTITSPEQLPEKVSEAFKSTFKGTVEPIWFHPNRNYVVTFLMNDIKHKALFSKNGYLIYHISYGNEKTIPADLKPMVNRKFEGYDIIAAINVKQNRRDIWFIIGQGAKDFLNVNIEEGVMSDGEKVPRYDVAYSKN